MSNIDYALTQRRSAAAISRHAQRHLFLFAMGVVDICSLAAAFAIAHWLRFDLGL